MIQERQKNTKMTDNVAQKIDQFESHNCFSPSYNAVKVEVVRNVSQDRVIYLNK